MNANYTNKDKFVLLVQFVYLVSTYSYGKNQSISKKEKKTDKIKKI